jgi:hypothetical protein
MLYSRLRTPDHVFRCQSRAYALRAESKLKFRPSARMPPKSTMKGQSSLISWVKSAPGTERPAHDLDAESDPVADDSRLLKRSVVLSSKAATAGKLKGVVETKQGATENLPTPVKEKPVPESDAAPSKPGAGKKGQKRSIISEGEGEEDEDDGIGLNRNQTHADDMKLAPLRYAGNILWHRTT